MNILITGGAGFIGSNAAHYFSNKGYNVIVLDNLLSGFYENIEDLVKAKKVKYYKDDIRDTEAVVKVFQENEIDVCINYAALVSVAESTENPLLTEDINVSAKVLNEHLSMFFTERQKQLILRKVYDLPLSKTEREYYSRTVKKRLEALSSPLLYKLAYAIISRKPQKIRKR